MTARAERWRNPPASGDVALLVPTCARYSPLAKSTAVLIDKLWNDHPPVYFCGMPNTIDPMWLELARAEVDWIGITHDACVQLAARGYTMVYLVLDDHPPIAECHASNLNEILPALARRHAASCIALNGWEHGGRDGRRPIGTVLKARDSRLERLPPGFRWSFSLHPALWDLGALVRLLDGFITQFPIEPRTPWMFERRAAEMAQRLELCPAYRISGRHTTISPMRWFRHEFARMICRVRRRFPASAGVDQAWNAAAQYYEGAYPLFWSGVMRQGKVNNQLLRFQESLGRHEWLEIVRQGLHRVESVEQRSAREGV